MKPAAKKAPVKKAAVKPAAKKTATKKVTSKTPTKAPAKAAPPKKAAAKAPAKKAADKKTVAAKPAVGKAAAKKAPVKSATAKVAKTPKASADQKAAKKKPTKKPASGGKKVARAVGNVQNFDDFKPYKPSRGESYMNEEQLEHFRGLLLQWRAELVDEVTRTVSHMKDEASNFPDPADRATQEEEFSLELRTRDRERKLIKKIDGTLERITIDDYGYCDACGIEIGVKRLEARPTATLCIDCKTLSEIKERQELG